MEDENPDPPTSSESPSEDEYPDRPLHELVADDKFHEVVSSRLEDPNERDEAGNTLLHAAVWNGQDNSKILQLLLDRNADVNSTAQREFTPLHIAVGFQKRLAVTALLDAGASINFKDDFGRTALHLAMGPKWCCPLNPALDLPCDMWIVEKLLSHPDINLNPLNKAGITPLMSAVMRQNSDAVRALLKMGANPNLPNKDNQTPLHVAFSSGDPSKDIVCDLLSRRVDIHREDEFGRTPMDLFFRHLPDDNVAWKVVWSIALRHRVRGSLLLELKKIPRLHKYYEKCLGEVRWMKREIVYQNFTLHDFACGRCPLGMSDPMEDVFMPVVKILLSAPFDEYTDFVLKRMTTRDLCRILRRTSGAPGIETLFENSMHSLIFWAIKTLYRNPS